MADASIGPAGPDEVHAIYRRRDGARSLVAALELTESGIARAATDQGEVVGIALAERSADEIYVGDLYVEPSYRNHGVGAALLGAVFEEAGDAVRALAIQAHPSGIACALKRRLPVRSVLLRVAGAVAREDDLLDMAAGEYRFEVDALDPLRHRFGVDGLDREVRGTTRGGAHEWFARTATGKAFFLNGEMVGYAYVWPDGRIGPMACASPAYAVQIFAFALVTLQRTYGASWCTLLLPGENLRVARAALYAGMRVEECGMLARDVPLPQPERYAGFDVLLF